MRGQGGWSAIFVVKSRRNEQYNDAHVSTFKADSLLLAKLYFQYHWIGIPLRTLS